MRSAGCGGSSLHSQATTSGSAISGPRAKLGLLLILIQPGSQEELLPLKKVEEEKKVLNNKNKNKNKEYTTTEAVCGLLSLQCLPSGGEVRQTLVKTVTEVSFWARARMVGEMTQGHCISLQSFIVKSTLTTVLTPSHDSGLQSLCQTCFAGSVCRWHILTGGTCASERAQRRATYPAILEVCHQGLLVIVAGSPSIRSQKNKAPSPAVFTLMSSCPNSVRLRREYCYPN